MRYTYRPWLSGLPKPPNDFLSLGWIYLRDENGDRITPEEREWLESWKGQDPLAVMQARDAYHHWFEQHAAEYGFTRMTTETWANGKIVTSTRRLRAAHRPGARLRHRRTARRRQHARARRTSTSRDDGGDCELAAPAGRLSRREAVR